MLDKAVALKCADISIALSQGADKLEKISGISDISIIERGGLPSCAVLMLDGTAYVIFRETSTLDDVILDLNLSLEDVDGRGKIHAGFKRAYESTRAQMLEAIDRIDTSKGIVFSGFSQGGAVATIASFDIASNSLLGKNTVVMSCTFGSPRVCDQNFKRAYSSLNIPTLRFVNADDPVTMVPFWEYRHACPMVMFDGDGDHVVGRPIGLSIRRSLAQAWLVFRSLLDGSLNIDELDHDMLVYRENIRRMKDGW